MSDYISFIDRYFEFEDVSVSFWQFCGAKKLEKHMKMNP